MEITELKNWFTSMVKPKGMDSHPSDEPSKMEGLLTRKDYFGVAFGALLVTAVSLFLLGISGLLADSFADPKGLQNTMSSIMIVIGLGFYGYALKMKPNSRFWGELGTYALVIFFTIGFLSLGTSMEWWKSIKTGIFILLFLYIPVLYLRKNVLGGWVYAGLLISYSELSLGPLGMLLNYYGAGDIGSFLAIEASSFWFWFFFAVYIPYFTLSFRENFRPGIESILLGYAFATLLLFGVSTSLGSHETLAFLLAASLLYLIGNIVYKHNYILFKPFQLISVFIFIIMSYVMMTKSGMIGLYGASGYMSFVSSILKEWTAYIVLIFVAVASFMVFMIWKSEYVDNDRKANAIAVILPFYFLLMAPLVNWGLGNVVIYLNIIVISTLAVMVTHYSLMDNKWYNLLWAPTLAITGLIALSNELDLGAKANSFALIVGAGAIFMLVMKFLPKISETMTPEGGDIMGTPNTGNATVPTVDTPAPAEEEPKAKESPKEEDRSKDTPDNAEEGETGNE